MFLLYCIQKSCSFYGLGFMQVIFIGHIICGVVATSFECAKEAAKKVKIDYQDLEVILTIEVNFLHFGDYFLNCLTKIIAPVPCQQTFSGPGFCLLLFSAKLSAIWSPSLVIYSSMRGPTWLYH